MTATAVYIRSAGSTWTIFDAKTSRVLVIGLATASAAERRAKSEGWVVR